MKITTSWTRLLYYLGNNAYPWSPFCGRERIPASKETRRSEVGSSRGGLGAPHALIVRWYQRSEAREQARRDLARLLDRIERTNRAQLAGHLGQTEPKGC